MVEETVAAESPMEARIARLESDIGHLRSDVTEIKVDLRSLRDQFSSGSDRLCSRIDRLAEQTDNRFDSVIAKLDGLGDSNASMRTWTLIVLVTFAAMTLGTMARGFGWI